MPYRYLSYRDVSVFSNHVAGFAVAGVSISVMPNIPIVPYQNLFLLQIVSSLICHVQPGTQPVESATAGVELLFESPASAGIGDDTTRNPVDVRIMVKSGQQTETPIFRWLPANSIFECTRNGRVWFPISAANVTSWEYSIQYFYKVKHFW